MRRSFVRLVFFLAALVLPRAMALAQNVGAVSTGDWSTASIWTTDAVPGASNTVYIGSDYPAGSAKTVTVTVSSAQSAANLFLGYNNSGQLGTLNLTGGALTISNSLVIGSNPGDGGTITESGGYFTASKLYVQYGNTLNLGASDAVSALTLQTGSALTTAATSNITSSVQMNAGSTLNLGANLSLSSTLDVEDTGSVVHMNGYNISANTIALGYGDHQTVTLDRGATPGSLTASFLQIGDNTLNLLAADTVTHLTLYSGTLTTAATSNITSSVQMNAGSTLNLGANLSLSSSLDVEDTGSVVHMNGYNISANTIALGYGDHQTVTLDRGATPGSLTTSFLQIGDNTLNLLATDTVTHLTLYSGTLTTAATSNITSSVQMNAGSTLNLGANLSLSSSLDVEDTGSVVHMNGYNISANTIELGYGDHQTVTLDRGATPGSLTTSFLQIGDNTLNLLATDTVTHLTLYSGTLTTAATSNITSSVQMNAGSTLNLGANLSLSSTLDVEDTGSVVNGHGFGIAANAIYAGYGDGQAVSLIDLGKVDTNFLYLAGGSTMTLHGGDVVNNLISLTGGSVLTVQETNGTGLTLNGTSLSSLTIDPSQMDLIFTLNSAPNWDFRWADPSNGGNWVSEIESLIASGNIVVTAPDGYSVVDQNGYTYVMGGFSAVPEPPSLVMGLIAAAGLAIWFSWNRRST